MKFIKRLKQQQKWDAKRDGDKVRGHQMKEIKREKSKLEGGLEDPLAVLQRGVYLTTPST